MSDTFSNGYPIPDDKVFESLMEEWEAEAESLGIPVDGLFTRWALDYSERAENDCQNLSKKPPPKPLPPLRRMGPGWMTTLKDIEGKQ